MKRGHVAIALAAMVLGALSFDILAQGNFWAPQDRPDLPIPNPTPSFRRVSTFANYANAGLASETVSEIVAATADGHTLVYTDSPGEAIGLVDISDPSSPTAVGVVALAGEPTSVDVLGNEYALVAVNTSDSFLTPSGALVVVDLGTGAIVNTLDLGGQPDSLKISPDEQYAAVAIENERDEDENDGELPQLPAGFLVVVDLTGDPTTWSEGGNLSQVALTGYSDYAPLDPEPEFVDINGDNEAVVTLQENNWVVIVDLPSAAVVDDFGAGTVNLFGVDATEDGVIDLSDDLADVAREPDGVAWVPGDRVATANEGDLFGGSRGFSFFERDGTVDFDSGTSLETIAVRHGHYPEDRSENKGAEPESIAFGEFGEREFVFVGSERGSFVAVYELNDEGVPEFYQLLPAPLGPEGLLPIPGRNLLVASGEEDDPSFGVRSTIMIYELVDDTPAYPQILSDSGASPIPWSALSGLTAVPSLPDTILGVWDSYYSASRIFRIDVSAAPALITDVLTISGGTGDYDPEGIAVAPDNTLWVASEGNASDSRPNRLLQLDLDGTVLAEIGLPKKILDCRAASQNRATLGSGFEGVAVLPLPGAGNRYRLLVAQQRGWDYTTPQCEAFDDESGALDANGQPTHTRIWLYDPQTGNWKHVSWELAPLSPNASWVGLSEITEAGSGDYLLIERDNRTGDHGVLKMLVKVNHFQMLDGTVTAGEKQVYDLRSDLVENHGWITDKPEGVAVLLDGRTFVVTDNDGVEDWSGETWFLDLGAYWSLF